MPRQLWAPSAPRVRRQSAAPAVRIPTRWLQCLWLRRATALAGITMHLCRRQSEVATAQQLVLPILVAQVQLRTMQILQQRHHRVPVVGALRRISKCASGLLQLMRKGCCRATKVRARAMACMHAERVHCLQLRGPCAHVC